MIDYVKRLAGPYTGIDQTTFSFSFKVYEETDIYVAISVSNDATPVNLTYGDDYSVTLNDDQDAAPGGSITLTSPLKESEILVIGSAIAYTQELQLTNYTRFPPEQINEALDRLCIQIQQILEKSGRALYVPATSSTTPEEMMSRLLEAQNDASSAAKLAQQYRDEAEEIREDTAELKNATEAYASATEVILPYKDDIASVADNINAVDTASDNITNINIVAGDLDTTTQPVDVDYGDYDDDSSSGTTETPVGGNIKTVADNITAVGTVAANIESILAIEGKIDGLDATIAEMEAQVSSSEINANAANDSAILASQSAQSAQTAKTQADLAFQLARDWATKLDGKVTEAGVEIDFSSKYWANVASAAATTAQNQLTLVEQAGDKAVADINSAQITAVSAVEAEGGEQVALARAQADAAASAATAAAESASEANTAKMSAESAASTATSKATEASNFASAANTAKTEAETAQAAAESARDEAEQIAGELGDPLGKDEAAQTYATKEEVNTGLSEKSGIGHTHDIADVDGLQNTLNEKLGKTDKAESASTADSVAWTNVEGKPETFTPSEHTHTLASISDAGSLAAKNEITEAELSATIDLGEYSDV